MLELIVLTVISKEDKYGYQLVSEVIKIVDVNEDTIYPLLKRLTNDKYCEIYILLYADSLKKILPEIYSMFVFNNYTFSFLSKQFI